MRSESIKLNNGVEILVAEDSPTQAEQLKHLLEERGYTVMLASNGKLALAAARESKPALVISDILMPEMDGYQLCKAIKADENLKKIPVILVTSLSSPQDVIKGLECGADNFIRKPYDEKNLLARLEYLRANRALRQKEHGQMGLEIVLGGQRHFITSERQQILDLLISTYEEAIRLDEGLQHAYQSLNGLYRIAEGLNQAGSEGEVCETALERAMELPGVQAGWISLREGEFGFRVGAVHGLPPALEVPGALEGECLCRRKLLAGELDHVMNILECERLQEAKGGTRGLRYHASIPLWVGSSELAEVGERILGQMNLAGAEEGLFSDEDLKILYGVGNQVGIALERAQLRERLEELVEERTAALRRREAILEAVSFAAGHFLQATSWEQNIQEVLERLGRAAAASRVYIFENHTGEDGALLTSQRYEWTAPGVAPQIDNPDLQNFPVLAGGFGRWDQLMSRAEAVVGHIRDFPESEREILAAQGIKSMVVAPVFVVQEWWGFIGFDECLAEREWSVGEVEALKAAAGTLGAAIQRQQAEAARRVAEARYRNIVERLPGIAYLAEAGEAGIWHYVSPQIEKMLGYTQEEWLADPSLWFQRLSPDDREYVMADEIEDWERGSSKPVAPEYRMVTRDGRTIWVRDEASIFLDDSGRPKLWQGVLYDITERKWAEEALESLRRQNELILNSAGEGIYGWDLEGRTTFVNPAAARMIGWEAEELIGRPIHDILHHTKPDGRPYPREECPIYATFRDGVTHRVDTEVFWKKDGTSFPTAYVSTPIRERNEIVGAVVVFEDITERKRMEEAEREQRILAEALRDTAAALNSTLDIGEVLERILDNVGRVVPHDAANIMLIESDSVRVVRCRGYAERGIEEQILALRFSLSDVSNLRQMAETGQPVVIPDTQTFPGWVALPATRWIRSYVSAPICLKGKTIGFLNLDNATPGFFIQSHAEPLKAFADQAASALENARLFSETERRLQHLTGLRTIDTAITSSLDLRLTLGVVLDQVTAQLKVDAADVLLLDPHLQTLEFGAGRGFRGKAIERSRLRLGEGCAGRAALERRTHTLSNLAEADDFSRAALVAGEGFVSYYAVPLTSKGQIKGVLEIFNRAPLNPDPEWLNYLETLAGQAAIAVDNATLFKDLQLSNTELRMAYDATIAGWSRAMDLRDEETQNHTLRVTEMTERLARRMGIGDADLVHIRRGGLLHDIGKMGVPDSVLLKPDKLTDEEWVLMRQHPQFAHDMLFPIAYLRPAMDIPYCHHEKWDGTGYPRGLKGEQIPLAARIFAVVDVYDALTSDRPYRKAWSKKKTLKYIQEQSGTHFDPAVVEAFLAGMPATPKKKKT